MIYVYVGCKLRGAPKRFLAEVNEIKACINAKTKTFKVLPFVTDPEVTPQGIYHNDILKMVKNCDMILAILNHPSTGLGLEMGAALFRHQKPILGIARNFKNTSGLIRGIDCEFGLDMFDLKRYRNPEHVVNVLLPAFAKQVGLPKDDGQVVIDLS